MDDKKLWEQHNLFQQKIFTLEDKQQQEFRKMLRIKNQLAVRGKEIASIRNQIRALYGKKALKTNDEIKKEEEL